MGGNFLNGAADVMEQVNSISSLLEGNTAPLRNMQARQQKAKLGTELVDYLSLGDVEARTAEARKGVGPVASGEKYSKLLQGNIELEPLISPQHLNFLQSVQGQGPEAVREMSNFLNKKGSSEELRQLVPQAINEYAKMGLLPPVDRMILLSRAKTDPEAAYSQLTSIANNSRTQTNQSITAASQAVGTEISGLNNHPAVVQTDDEAKIAQVYSTYTPEQASSINLEDATTYPGLNRPQASSLLRMIERGKAKGIKPAPGMFDGVQNFASQVTGGAIDPAAKVVTPGELAEQTRIQAPEAALRDSLRKQQQDLQKQKAANQFRGPKPKTKAPPSDTVTFRASDGKSYTIPKKNLKAAQARDPKLVVIK